MALKLRGIPRSDMAHITACADSGTKETKSHNVSCADAPVGISVGGSGFTACTKCGNLMASGIKTTGASVATRPELPSSVENLVAQPRVSRPASAEPRGPCTVEKRTNTGVCTLVLVRKPALVSFSLPG